jgi:hypothetical protein
VELVVLVGEEAQLAVRPWWMHLFLVTFVFGLLVLEKMKREVEPELGELLELAILEQGMKMRDDLGVLTTGSSVVLAPSAFASSLGLAGVYVEEPMCGGHVEDNSLVDIVLICPQHVLMVPSKLSHPVLQLAKFLS